MAVVETVWLPAQPTVGFTHVQPLGGNGRTAPSSQVYTRATSAGDASGGTNQIELRFDQDHSTMLHWLAIGLTGLAANGEAIVDLRFGNVGASMRQVQSVTLVYNSITSTAYALVRPPPVICPPRPGAGSGGASAPFVEVVVANAAGDDLTIDAMAFEFDPSVSHITPWPMLSANFAS